MDIIKSILHVFKKSDNAFKVMHPETESACITDWNQGIVNTLASTGLSSLVNVLSSDSLLALLIKKVFDATGVKYSLGQNGYVCFGSLFGGLIIQWVITGNDPGGDGGVVMQLPIAFSESPFLVIANAEQLIANTGYGIGAGGNRTSVWADTSITDYVYPYRVLAMGV